MSRGAALGLAAFLFLGWLANLAVSANRGGHRELYPLTAFPMFAGSSGAPSRAVVEYVFLVEARPGDELREVPATAMVRRHRALGRSRTSSLLTELEKTLRSAGSTELERGRAVAPDLASIWFANARDALGLDQPPHAVRFARLEVPLDQPFAALRRRRGTIETIAIVSAAEARL
jgi:hypothetical protein